jgi:hypothetical protein
MGISKQPPKRFPLAGRGKACQLKWTQGTVYLTDGISASCHKAGFGKYIIDNGEINFHNTPDKIEDRQKMLRGEWPGSGCEHCKHIEEAGGESDRTIHLQMEGTAAPPELEHTPEAVEVTPRILEVYWGNTCNQKCIYCAAHYSSQIHQEEKRFGTFNKDGIELDYNKFTVNPNIERDTEMLFRWFDKHMKQLHKIIVLGGEPFLQKETFRLIELLEKSNYPDLTLVFFSNHNVEHERFKGWIQRLERLQKADRLDKIQIFFSCDALGTEGEYVRTGLDLKLAIKNFEYVLHQTNIEQAINSALTVTAVPGMPALVRYINRCNQIKPIYWSMTKAANRDHPGTAYLYPGIFGSKINDWGLREAVEMFDVKTNGSPDSVKQNHKKFMQGNIKEFDLANSDVQRMRQFRTYLNELDRRRGTDWKKIYPQMWDLVKDL